MLARLILAALVALGPAAAAAQSGSHDDPYGPELNYFKRPQQGAVPILTADGTTATIETVFIRTGRDVLAVEARAGVDAVDQNRIRLSGVPVVGQLFRHRYSQNQLSPTREAGPVFRAGNALYADLGRDGRYHPVTSVAILNQEHAYELKGAPRPARVEGEPYARRVGTAYLTEGSKLLILIEPSVITHNVFDRLL